jgi:hypothetical protein
VRCRRHENIVKLKWKRMRADILCVFFLRLTTTSHLSHPRIMLSLFYRQSHVCLIYIQMQMSANWLWCDVWIGNRNKSQFNKMSMEDSSILRFAVQSIVFMMKNMCENERLDSVGLWKLSICCCEGKKIQSEFIYNKYKDWTYVYVEKNTGMRKLRNLCS